MLSGVSKDQSHKLAASVYDRGEAIHLACSSASPTDFVVIAGRGHEKFILSNGEMRPFDDLVVLHECLKKKMSET